VKTTKHDLTSFTSFARQRIETGVRDLIIDELFDQWRAENPSDESYAKNVAAINASIQAFKYGERGSIAGQHSMQLRRDFVLPDE